MGINTSPLGGEGTSHKINKTQHIHKPIRRQTSISEITLDIPHPVPMEAGKRDLGPSLISTSSYSRRKIALSSTTSWLSSRQVNDD